MELEPTLKTRAAIAFNEETGRAFAGNVAGVSAGPHRVADRPVQLNRLFGKPDAEGNEVRKFEQPWQRNAAYMVASGQYSLKAVASACDKGYDTVKALMRNPWFQETVAAIQRENGAQDIMDIFRAECASSLVTIVELRDDPKAPASVRRACAMDIIAQVYGKPTQKVEQETTLHSSDPAAEVERLERENAMLRPESAGSRSEMTDTQAS